MNQDSFQDKVLDCVERNCPNGGQFIFQAGEQFFLHRLLEEGKLKEVILPRRCADCRKKFKARRENKLAQNF